MKSGSANEHRGTVLLKPEENEQVFRLLGNRCQCLAAAVVQLYLTEPPVHNEWIKRSTGIITLIRDNPKRSYFLRLYCLQRKAMLWEHEIYNSIDYKAPTPFFHTFEGEDCMTAFNFASETEAVILKNVLSDKLNARRRSRQERRKVDLEVQRSETLPKKSQSNMPTMSVGQGATGGFLNNGTLPSFINTSSSSAFKHKTKKKDKLWGKDPKRRLTTADIGLPSNFRHVKHVGLDAEPQSIDLDSFRGLLHEAGVSDTDLRNEETCVFIKKFLKDNLPDEPPALPTRADIPPPPPAHHSTPPPVPARTIPVNTSASPNSRNAPPLPPSRTNMPPPIPSVPPVHKTLPSRPPPPVVTQAATSQPPPPLPPMPPTRKVAAIPNNAPAPPPPPPLPTFSLTEATPVNINTNTNTNVNATNNNTEKSNTEDGDARNTLMESIRSGTTLKKVKKDESKQSPVQDSRSDLLTQIRQGIELKPVSNEPRPSAAPTIPDGIALALSRALAQRARAIHSDSEDSTSDTSEDDDEWDD